MTEAGAGAGAGAARHGILDRTDTVLCVGAGPSGLAAVKNLRERAIRAEAVEAHSDLGGNWNIDNPQARVYGSTHFISSKPLTSFPDFPMPGDYPDYPRHDQFLAYLRRYAAHFGLAPHLRFSTRLERAEPVDPRNPGTDWRCTLALPDGSTETADYRALVVGNGHNWDPKIPSIPGMESFTGEIIHSAAYKDPEFLAGKRVLVVGAGNTGCDIAVESAQHASRTLHSTRRGYWYAPKYSMGRPADQVGDLLHLLRLPLRVRQALIAATIRTLTGDPRDIGMQAPDHRPLEVHMTVNSLLTYYVGQGDVVPVPDVRRFAGGEVEFADGRREAVDVVVLCTGYVASFPFLDTGHLNWRDGRPHLHQHLFSPMFETLYVVGLLQSEGAAITPIHWQTVAVAEFLRARERDPVATRAWFDDAVVARADADYTGGIRHDESTRHYFEIEHVPYLRGVEGTIRALEVIG